ncbi:MAG: hypothetical protein NUV49_00890 [Patescibacteria group bacterium]|nr:hypothetical protein [Patescibacteria group bacterium]
MITAINFARHALSLGLSRKDAKSHLTSKGVSPEDAFLAVAAAIVLDREDYECVPETGNRKEYYEVTMTPEVTVFSR